jgi:PAS domain S-box-containing protein
MDGIVFDITERQIAQAEQRRQDARLRAIIESAEDMIHLKNRRLEYTHVNSAFAAFMRRSQERLIGISDMELLPAREAELSLQGDRLVLAGNSHRGEISLLVEGQERRIETIKVPVRDDTGEVIAICAISRDISEAVRIRSDLESALEEKNVLLRELYHRTKNNMQVIASMVALRRFGIEDENQQAVLQEIEGKIHSMALVHKRLYQTRDLSRLDIKVYIEELAELIHARFENRTKNIRFRFDLEPAQGLIDTAVPLGLVLNELLVNSIKHAFPGRESGEILISMRTAETGGIELNVRDNGIGLPEGFNPAEAGTLGLQTVYSIVEGQLNGSVEYESVEGTEWRLKLGSVDYRERV